MMTPHAPLTNRAAAVVRAAAFMDIMAKPDRTVMAAAAVLMGHPMGSPNIDRALTMAIAGRATLKELKRTEDRVDIDGNTFILREMSGAERDEFEIAALQEVPERDVNGAAVTDEKGMVKMRRAVNPKLMRARLIALCWVGEDGERIYGDKEIGELAQELRARDQDTLFARAQKLNGLDDKALETAGKNSGAGQNGDSTSASPVTLGTPSPTSSPASPLPN